VSLEKVAASSYPPLYHMNINIVSSLNLLRCLLGSCNAPRSYMLSFRIINSEFFISNDTGWVDWSPWVIYPRLVLLTKSYRVCLEGLGGWFATISISSVNLSYLTTFWFTLVFSISGSWRSGSTPFFLCINKNIPFYFVKKKNIFISLEKIIRIGRIKNKNLQ